MDKWLRMEAALRKKPADGDPVLNKRPFVAVRRPGYIF